MNPTFQVIPYPASASIVFQQQGYPLRNTFNQSGTTFMDSDLDVALPHPTRKKSVFDQPDDLGKFALLSSSSSAGTGSLTEFTKRKNWSQRIIDEIKDFLHVLSPLGKIMYSAPSSLELLGFSPEELVGRHITEFIHVDDIDMFIREFQMAIHTRRNFKLYYRFRKKDDKFIIFEVTGHPYFTENSAVAKCFFAMAQPYPTKSTSMLDSFLELKIENERLRRKLRELRSSRHAEKNEKSGPPLQSSTSNAPTPTAATGFYDIIGGEDIPTDISEATPYVDELNTNISYPVINQAVPETIELLTGLNYKDGERAPGISTGSIDATLSRSGTVSGSLNENSGKNDDPLTVVGTNNMAALSLQEEAKKDPKTPRKKKAKMEDDEYVCTDCGTTESPEWRKGPNGPKTLCNACGLRWSKKNKKNTGGGEMGENVDVNM